MGAKLEDFASEAETVRDEMQSDFDEKSEKWQESEKGEAAQDKINEMETASEALAQAVSELESAISAIDNATAEE